MQHADYGAALVACGRFFFGFRPRDTLSSGNAFHGSKLDMENSHSTAPDELASPVAATTNGDGRKNRGQPQPACGGTIGRFIAAAVKEKVELEINRLVHRVMQYLRQRHHTTRSMSHAARPAQSAQGGRTSPSTNHQRPPQLALIVPGAGPPGSAVATLVAR